MKNVGFSIWHSVQYTFNELNVVWLNVRALNGTNTIHSLIAHGLSRRRHRHRHPPTESIQFYFDCLADRKLGTKQSPKLSSLAYAIQLKREMKITFLLAIVLIFFWHHFRILKWSHSAQTGTNSNVCKSNARKSLSHCKYTPKRSIAQHIIFNFTTFRRPRTYINSRSSFAIHFRGNHMKSNQFAVPREYIENALHISSLHRPNAIFCMVCLATIYTACNPTRNNNSLRSPHLLLLILLLLFQEWVK